MFFEPFPLQEVHFLLANHQIRFFGNTPEIGQIVHRISQPEITGVGCTKRLGDFILSDDIAGFIEAVFATGDSRQHIVDIQIQLEPIANEPVRIFHGIRIVKGCQAVFPRDFGIVFFSLRVKVSSEKRLEIRRYPVILGNFFFFLQCFVKGIELFVRYTSPLIRITVRLFEMINQVLIVEFKEEQIDQLLIGFRQYAVQFLSEFADGIGQFTIVERDIGESCD